MERTNRKNLLHKEPAVINQDMIIEALKKVLPKGSEGKYAKEAGIDLTKAEALTIEFQSISQIAHISHMVNLTKLALSNNVIIKIERLDELINLQELDLSFNAIKKLEGLENLRNLKILNVHRNLISVIENLDNNLRLEVLICSTNVIKGFRDIHHLRRLVRLRALNLDGNPMCDDPDYRNFVIALLPDLLILDYVRIKPQDRTSPGVIQFSNQVQAIAVVEDALRRRASLVEASEELQKIFKEANVDGLEEDEFWNSLYANDLEGQKVLELPGGGEIRDTYKGIMSQTCHVLFVKTMTVYAKRKKEHEAFEIAVKEIKEEVITHGRHLVEEFLDFSNKAMLKIRPIMSQLDLRDRMNGGSEFKGDVPPEYIQFQERLTAEVLTYIKKLHKVWYCLVSTEVELSEQLTEVGEELQENIKGLMNEFIDELAEYFSQIREVQFELHDQLIRFVAAGKFRLSHLKLPKKVRSQEISKERDSIRTILEASHESHLATIEAKYDALTNTFQQWTECALVSIRTDEVDRSRRRLSEISHFADYHYGKLKDLKILDHCLGYVPSLREDQNHIPTKEERKAKRLAKRQVKELQKQLNLS